jgi:hypothetical protein
MVAIYQLIGQIGECFEFLTGLDFLAYAGVRKLTAITFNRLASRSTDAAWFSILARSECPLIIQNRCTDCYFIQFGHDRQSGLTQTKQICGIAFAERRKSNFFAVVGVCLCAIYRSTSTRDSYPMLNVNVPLINRLRTTYLFRFRRRNYRISWFVFAFHPQVSDLEPFDNDKDARVTPRLETEGIPSKILSVYDNTQDKISRVVNVSIREQNPAAITFL